MPLSDTVTVDRADLEALRAVGIKPVGVGDHLQAGGALVNPILAEAPRPTGPRTTAAPRLETLEYTLRVLQLRSRELAKRQAALLESIRATEIDIAVMRGGVRP